VKASMYLNYSSRSLFRDGQRTLLAIFCVAVGVMAIVALQLVGLMINNAFTGNVRDANGGDIAIRSQQPFTTSDLKYFDSLKKDGSIADYVPVITSQATTGAKASQRQSFFSLRIIDPQHYPSESITPPGFVTPADGTLAALVKNGGVVATQAFMDQYHKKIGDSLDITISSQTQGSNHSIHTKIVGIVSETGVLAQAGSVVLLSASDYHAASPQKALTYDTVDVTVSQAKIDAAVKKIQNKFPIATTQTAADALKQEEQVIGNIRKFLEIAGLLALLIGGVGIVNTMQVLLSRRKTEIAMLKTTGYRRSDLYLLFGLEAGLLGLIGGLLGAFAAIGISYLVRTLVQDAFGLNIPFLLDWLTIGGGVVIGLSTSLIFGLLPIVQAANIRPLNVIRELPEGRGTGSIVLIGGLLLILSVLFCILSIIILGGDIQLGVISVYGIFIFLGLLSLILGVLILLVSRLPVPERFSRLHILLIVGTLIIAAVLYQIARPYSLMFVLFAILGLIVLFVPRTLKATTKMALRNLARQRGRTTTTMLALFVGIFTIGLILALGQDLRTEVNSVITNALNYNVFAITTPADTKKLQDKLSTIPGLSAHQVHTLATTAPLSINGKPLQVYLNNPTQNGNGSSLRQQTLRYYLSGVEGYDVAKNQLPVVDTLKIVSGRNLRSADAGTNNVVVSQILAQQSTLHLKLGDKITLTGISKLTIKTVTVIGFYQTTGFGANLDPILGTNDTTNALAPSGRASSAFYLKIDPNKLNSAIDSIGQAVPNAFLLSLASLVNFIDQLLNDILLTLTTIASLTLLAGVIIIANAVALAMLERRRELGILKSVGYTSRTILSEVLLENGLVGGLGALVAMVMASVVTWLLGIYVFKTTFTVGTSIVLGLVLGSVILAMITSLIVAWGSVRVRPLEVLRYE
jgi:putative ABC transport system permease protein